MKDGHTLTDADCAPHEIQVMEKLGYSADHVTSVERVIKGRHLSIAKSRFIENFFVGTEESIDMKMGSRHQEPAIVTKRMLGCYLKDSDPVIQARLIMDPRTFNTQLKIFKVKRKTLRGINAKPLEPKKKGALDKVYMKEIIDNQYTIVESPAIKSFFNTPMGFGCYVRKPHVRAELVIKGQNVLLGFTQPGQKLKVEFE